MLLGLPVVKFITDDSWLTSARSLLYQDIFSRDFHLIQGQSRSGKRNSLGYASRQFGSGERQLVFYLSLSCSLKKGNLLSLKSLSKNEETP